MRQKKSLSHNTIAAPKVLEPKQYILKEST